jgi:hypothetical protein
MADPVNRVDRYRKMAADFSDLAKDASTDFARRYFERLAKQYSLLEQAEFAAAEGQGEMASLQPESSAVERSSDEDQELGDDLVALVPPGQIGQVLSAEEAGRLDGSKTVPKRRKSKSKKR